jgi:hypothetical protein
MNFFSVLKKIGQVALGIEHVAVPLVEIADPTTIPALSRLDNWVNRISAGVVTVEAQVAQAKAGGLKSASVVADVQNGLADLNSGLALVGKTVQYDPAELQKVVDAFAAAYNQAATFKQGWKIVDLPPAPPPAA